MKIFVMLTLLTMAFSTNVFAENIQTYHCDNYHHQDCYQTYHAHNRDDGCYDRPQQRRQCDSNGYCRW